MKTSSKKWYRARTESGIFYDFKSKNLKKALIFASEKFSGYYIIGEHYDQS